MPPTVEDRLRDDLEAITEIDDVMRGINFDQFASDRRTRLLVERLLGIVCEASRSIPDDIKNAHQEIDWRKMIDFGNLLRHAYHATKPEIVWEVLQQHLPRLRSVAEALIHAPSSSRPAH